jgi:hypothetical protein
MPEKKYSINSDRVVWRDIEGEAVILNLDTGYYYNLNAIGSLIWRLLDEKKDISKIIETISKDYNISVNRAKKDLDSLISDLKKEKLLLVK